MSGDTLSILLVGAVGIAVGIWYTRRQNQIATTGAQNWLSGTSLWNQVPIAAVPGPQATWSLL